MEEKLSMDSILRRNDEIVSGDIDGDTVMMSIESGRYFGLNQTGSRIWEVLVQPKSVNEICEVLKKEYKFEPEKCQKDVLDFLLQLLKRKIIEIV